MVRSPEPGQSRSPPAPPVLSAAVRTFSGPSGPSGPDSAPTVRVSPDLAVGMKGQLLDPVESSLDRRSV